MRGPRGSHEARCLPQSRSLRLQYRSDEGDDVMTNDRKKRLTPVALKSDGSSREVTGRVFSQHKTRPPKKRQHRTRNALGTEGQGMRCCGSGGRGMLLGELGPDRSKPATLIRTPARGRLHVCERIFVHRDEGCYEKDRWFPRKLCPEARADYHKSTQSRGRAQTRRNEP